HGEAFTNLEPGEWQLLVASAAWGLQQRDLVVPEDSRSLVVVDVVFSGVDRGNADLVLTVLRPDGAPVNGAAVYLDGSPLGATSTGGSLRLSGIAGGRRQLRVVAPLFEPTTRVVTLVDGEQSLEVPLDWAPGAVKVVARSEEGPVTDAVIRFAGPSVYPPVRVDQNGERLVALSPGSWQGLAASATHGLQERRVEVSPDQRKLVVVEFVMRPVAAGRAELLVRVVDPTGEPVRGATVTLAGEPRGTTAGGGAVLMTDLDPGKTSFEVEASDFRTAVVEALRLREGSQERLVELQWVPAMVAVSVKDTDGAPVHAKVQAEGPEDLTGADTDAAGEAILEIPPGTWQVVVTSTALGTQSRTLEVLPGVEVAPLTFELQAARVDLTTRQVVIREKVHFDFDEATLRPESAAILAEVAATILSQPRIVRVEVQGHTDNTGGAAYNLDLSQRRAQAVVDALADRGVAPERLDARGYGFTRPVASNEIEEGKAQNRRVQFEIQEWAD
ncbi:MAG: OmpA family protein, partial [Deltaproteobacteria bacterium]|nr:OmpA family protein [Deltaproteobacteria bacterium]